MFLDRVGHWCPCLTSSSLTPTCQEEEGVEPPCGLFVSSESFGALADLFLQNGCAGVSALQG